MANKLNSHAVKAARYAVGYNMPRHIFLRIASSVEGNASDRRKSRRLASRAYDTVKSQIR